MASPSSASVPGISRPPAWRRVLGTLKPSHAHSAFSATLLLSFAALLSKVISLVRTKYMTHLLGRGPEADAFNAMFQLPDTIAYFLVGGATSITFVTMLTRYSEQGREQEGEQALSVILTTVSLVLGLAILLAEILTPLYVRNFMPGFDANPAKLALCVHLTRIVLPAQLFFFTGGLFGAVLLARKQFSVQAFAPLIYNLGMVLGGVLLYWKLGVSSIAWGALAGVILGPFAVNGIAAYRAGMRFRLQLDFANPGLHTWFRTTLPLILGFSLVTVDQWIINYFASYHGGEVSLLTYAKQLFSVPQSLGQAAGAASLPFLASLFARDDRRPFAESVNQSVSRMGAFSLLLSSWMVAMGRPAIDLIFRGGQFHRIDADSMALFFAIFSASLPLWSAQAIYARAFYATGDTKTPMIASSIVTVVSLPIYATLFRLHGAPGLALASDLGIGLQTVVFALLLDRMRLVAVRGLEGVELVRAGAATGISLLALFLLRHLLPAEGTRLADLLLLVGSTLTWFVTALGTLALLGSALPGQLLSRLRR